jgi:ABC-type nickel/cobalt efflux system permease component RcnA
MSLGALHALEPGHGKTLVAAYLVGSRGTARHAIVLGSIVTLAHTAGVYALGAITLYASRYILPEKIYPWLGVASGLIIAGLGLLLFMRRWVGEDPSLREDHSHWYDVFSSPSSPTLVDASSAAVAVPAREAISFKQLLVLGITGGILPCPAALVVLLSAIALHRIAFGFFLIVTFSIGLAAVLIGIGLMFVHAGRWLHRLNPQSTLIRRHLPLLSAAFITAIGVALTLQAMKSAGFAPHAAAVIMSPKWLLIAGVGLVLGMRHSTDPDHVIAVTTIVTRLRSLRSASLVGMIWGVGHTLTIFVVGSAIILFRIVIPPRIGLSMEFAVALMLILLGIMNLTGLLQWVTDRFSPGTGSRDLTAAARSPELPLVESPIAGNALQRLFTRFGAYQLLRPLAIGIVHGLAGSAAVALLVLATIHNPVWAMGYLLLFGSGTILGMMLMTAVIALPVVWTGKSFLRLNRYLCTTSGILSLAFGLFLVYQIGFVSGLFTSAPNWIPS